MDTRQVLTCFICLILCKPGVTHEKAKQKCSEYVRHEVQIPEIVGGERTARNEFPHMVALGYGSQKNPEWLCGGTLISDEFVLTAAHCTNVRDLGSVKVVRLGTRSLSHRGNSLDIKVDRIIRNPNYKSPSTYNDIALLKLQRKVEFSNSILPACLNTAFKIPSRDTLTALGWGRTEFVGPTSEDLLKVQLRLYRPDECNRSYRGSSKDKLPRGIKNETQLCAGGELHKDTCQGDSGGPLEYQNGRFHYIVGVTSFGKACGISRAPGVYTRVSAFMPWIESVVWP